tara:strand:- start:259 stop:1524 length:1266 start_codon:yes stop_codon:yes gene_type:complete
MLQEYETQSTLNPKLWKGNSLKTGLSEKFLRIANEFYNFLDIHEDIEILDVLLIGSNANYNWTDSSDIDLHVVIDYQLVGDNLHLVKNYMMAKKSIWGHNYPLKYKGMDIELYAQDQNDKLHSSVGRYSLMNGKWLTKPNSSIISIDDEIIDSKSAPLEYEIKELSEKDPQLEYKIKHIIERLYKMRRTGLEAEGEYSIENLAFKKLRSRGLLDLLKQMGKRIALSKLQIHNPLINEQVVGRVKMDPIGDLAAHMTKRKILDNPSWDYVLKHMNAVEDPKGQWKYPKRCTVIPSNQITMKNVPYKVLGIDDTGHSKVMHPEKDYGYPGGKVLEIPMTPEHSTILKKLKKLLTDMTTMTEQDFAGPFGKEHDYGDYGGPWGTGHHHKTDFKKGPGTDPTKSIGHGRSKELANILRQTGYKKG